MEETVEVIGARVHNLKNINVTFPRNKLVVVTGLSGSGKSSFAFDTIYAEGQRRYIETFSAYARKFLGTLERPDVDKINGLSPVISIEQKTTSKNPRSTVGTITEIYDFMRLLFARVGEAYSYVTGEKMIKYTHEQIIEQILTGFIQKKLLILAPVVKGRKGHYRELFEQYRKKGFLKARIDGQITDLQDGLQTERFKIHNIEIVVDRIHLTESSKSRLYQSTELALKIGNGQLMVEVLNENPSVSVKGNIFNYSKNLMCPVSGISYDEPAPNAFSFNSPYGACPNCNGLGKLKQVKPETLTPDKTLSIENGGLAPLKTIKTPLLIRQIEALGKVYNFNLQTPVGKISQKALEIIFNGTEEKMDVPFDFNGTGNTYSIQFEGLSKLLLRIYNDSPNYADWIREFLEDVDCPACEGTRLKKESLFFKIADKNISELCNLEIAELKKWFSGIEKKLQNRQVVISKEILKEIKTRIDFLLDVGLDYLTLNRTSKTLSGGEAQRIRLATQIGSQLVGVHYILDEPSIGLHYRDNIRLINALKNLRDIGNSVLVVEHDKEIIENADFLIDLGPGAGVKGGELVLAIKPSELNGSKSLTAAYLTGSTTIPIPSERRNQTSKKIKIFGAKGNNLQNIDVEFPVGCMICVTGVSGSGKSSLVNDTLYPVISQKIYGSRKNPLPFSKIEGLELIDKVIEIDQSPIGRTPRSNPATYTGVFNEIRNLFSQLPEAKIRGYKAGRFSFNVKGGRCETCMGGGSRIIEMYLLPDVQVLCEDCNGNRYNRETLEVRYKGKSINDVLNMTVTQAVDFFENIPSIIRKIKTIADVGLGYISLGQSSTTLSGGEAQRVKLATELSKKDTCKTLYILDEPTTGLHFEDIKALISILNKLVDRGNTVIVIEHNMDVIKVADYIIDLGPEGGQKGGTVVGSGTPEELSKIKTSFTGQFLRKELGK